MRRSLGLLLLLANISQSAEVVPMIVGGKLGARIDATSFPDTLPKELTSGLTNRLYARVTLADIRGEIDQRNVEVAIRYDLWDQKFSVTATTYGAESESRSVANLAELNSMLNALPLPGLFDLTKLPAARDLTLRVDLLLNPIDREKMRMIRKWVAQNSTPDAGPEKGISTSNTLFNQIFEQYARGSDLAAVWRTQATSEPFRMDSLQNETR